MERNSRVTDSIDGHQYDQIWQRVAPTLEPYPGTVTSGTTVQPQTAQPLQTTSQPLTQQPAASQMGTTPATRSGGTMTSADQTGAAPAAARSSTAVSTAQTAPMMPGSLFSTTALTAQTTATMPGSLFSTTSPTTQAATTMPSNLLTSTTPTVQAAATTSQTATTARNSQAGTNGQTSMLQNSQTMMAENCCMVSMGNEDLQILTNFIEDELSDQRYYQAFARQAPGWARKTLMDFSATEGTHARRLMAVYFLITGSCYTPSVSCERIWIGPWCSALRERYHMEACGGQNYVQAAQSINDPCLSKLLIELSEDEYGHAEAILAMLQKVI